MRKVSLIAAALLLVMASACAKKGRNVRKLKKNCNCPKWSQVDPADETSVPRCRP